MTKYTHPLPEYCVNRERDGIHINAQGKPVVVEVGCDQAVTIEKMFGPLIFATLRVTAEFQSCEFVVERQRIDSGEWVVVARIPGQQSYEYDEAHPEHKEPTDGR